MLLKTQVFLIAVCAASIAAGVKIDNIELENGMPFLKLTKKQSAPTNLVCTYTLAQDDADIHIYWTKDGEPLKDAPSLIGRRESKYELVNIERDDAGIYNCKVTSGADSDQMDFNLVVLEKMPGAARDTSSIDYTHYNCRVSYNIHLSETWPARLAYCGIKSEVTASNKQEWLQKPFENLPAGTPKLGFSSNGSDWSIQKSEKLEGDFYSLSLNKTLDVREISTEGPLWAVCEWFVADKNGNAVESLMDINTPVSREDNEMLNSCPASPFLAVEEKDTYVYTYGEYRPNCRNGKWGSDGNIMSSLTCKRTGEKISIGCYGNQWEVALNESTKKEVFSKTVLDEFSKTCGEGRLLPVFGLVIAAVLFNLTSK